MTHSRTGFRDRLACWLSTLVFTGFWPAAVVGQGMPKADFDIPPQRLETALQQVAQVQRVQILFSENDVKGLETSGVKGKLSTYEAVQKLIEGTGLSAVANQNNAIAIKPRSANERGGQAADPTVLAQAQSAERHETMPSQGPRTTSLSPDIHKVESIMVTAQKREERLVDVPLSVSVLSATEMQRRGLVSREDYMRSIPNIALRDDGPGLNEIVVRGAFGDKFSTGPTVGLYFGDVPLTGFAIGGSADVKLVDMERVEVLRGPQGTLYGSNALSGAVRYIPVAPDLRDFTGQVKLGYSRTGGYGGNNTDVEAVLNVPVVEDKVAVRVVAFRHYNEGYVRNVAGDDAALQASAALVNARHLAVNKDHVGSTEISGGRISALWRPTAELNFNLTYLKQKDSQEDRLFEVRQYGPYLRSDYQFGDTIGGNKDALRLDLDILNLTAEYDLGWGTLYSSSAWMDQLFIRKWDVGFISSLYGSPLRPIPQISTTNADMFAQEVRLTSKFGGRSKFVAGLYYEKSAQPTTQMTFFGGDPALNPFRAVKLWQADLDRLVTQKAAFGELSYGVSDKLELTLGGRLFKYDTRFWTRFFDTVVLPESFSDVKSAESGKTFKAGISYKPRKDALIYATWSQGFRLGRPLSTDLIRSQCDTDRDGFLDGTDIPSTLDKIKSDSLDNYELGAKFSFMDGRATVNTAIYQNNWKDIPVTFLPPGCFTTTTINGGTARARGFEGEGSFRLLGALRLSFGIGYVDSVLTQTTSLGSSGDRLNFAPKFNGNLGAEYDFSIAGKRAFVRGDYLYFGSYYTATGEKGLRADPYNLVNLRAGVMLSDQVSLQFHIGNLLNSDAFTSVIAPSGVPPGYAVRLRPRTFGVDLAYSF